MRARRGDNASPESTTRRGATHMRLSNAVEKFVQQSGTYLNPETQRKYRGSLNMLAALATVGVGDGMIAFDRALVREFFQKRAGKSHATLHRDRAALTTFTKWCLNLRLIADNPMGDAPRIKRPK